MIVPTKLSIPETRGRLIPREHLFKRLDEGLSYSVTLVIAGAGYGKSTLLSEWAGTLPFQPLWVSLDQYDNQGVQFWFHLLEALNDYIPEEDKNELLEIIQEDQGGHSMVPLLLNFLHYTNQNIVLILDDFHVIDNQYVIENVSSLLQRMPAHVHIYIASRENVPVHITKFRIAGKVNEISQEDLQFNKEEAAVFFEACTDIKLTMQMYKQLWEKTEGWITGMRLLSLSLEKLLQKGQNTEESMYISFKEKYVMDYFFEEVLKRQSTEMQEFLLKTSVLDRMNVALAESVTGNTTVPGILQRLEEENLFLVSLDPKKEWYRYHHLFQDYLQMQFLFLDPNGVKQTRIKAGNWLYDHDYRLEAAVHFAKAEEYEKALQLLDNMIEFLPIYEQISLYRWLKDIPNQVLFLHRDLFLINLASLFLSGYKEKATNKYWWAWEYLQSEACSINELDKEFYEAGLDFIVAFRSFYDQNFDDFIMYSEKYLSKYPNGELLINFGINQFGNHSAWDIFISDKEFHKAKSRIEQLMDLWEHTENQLFYAHLCIDYGKVLYEKNQLSTAEQFFHKANSLGEKHGNTSIIVNSSLMLARLSYVEGKSKQASDYLTRGIETARLAKDPILIRRTILFKNESQSKYVNGAKWRNSITTGSGDELSLLRLNEYFLKVMQLGLEKKYDEAFALTDRLLILTSTEYDDRNNITLNIYKGILCYETGDPHGAYGLLEAAISIAMCEGYIRTILDIGWKVEELLQKYVQTIQQHHYEYRDKGHFDYAKKLLEVHIQEKIQYGQLVDKNLLTEKELLVLSYIHDGLTNREIADNLQLSLATIKTHINNLYRKLNVNNRILALQKAQELFLLDMLKE